MNIWLNKTGVKVYVERFATFECASQFAREGNLRMVRGDDECIWVVSEEDFQRSLQAGHEEVRP